MCPDFGSDNVTITDDLNTQMRYSHRLDVSCDGCPYSEEMFTSQLCDKSKKQGWQILETNIRKLLHFVKLEEVMKIFKMLIAAWICFVLAIILFVQWLKSYKLLMIMLQ